MENVANQPTIKGQYQLQMPDIRLATKSKRVHEDSMMNSFRYPYPQSNKNQGSSMAQPADSIMSPSQQKSPNRMQQQMSHSVSLLYTQAKESQVENQRHVKSMRRDLKDLIEMEPYAHRTRQLQQAQQTLNQSQASLSNSQVDLQSSQRAVQRENQAPKLNMKQIEAWLNSTLEFQMQEQQEEAERMINPGAKNQEEDPFYTPVPRQNKSNKPLIQLEIDRIALDKSGVDQVDVDRIYKGLYASSVGVYDTLRTSLANVHSSEQYRVLGRLWNAFQMLLQHCCPSDFQMIGKKLMEDQIKEINKVKSEYAKYKSALEEVNKKQERELKEIQRSYAEISDEVAIETQKRQDADKRLLALQTKHEDEVRLRLDFEIKINKLHNLTMALKNHEVTLNRRIEELEHNQSEYRERLTLQQEEIVSLRSWKQKYERTHQLDEVKIESVKQNVMMTREKLITATMKMQQKDKDLAQKTNLTLQLQSVVDNRDSRIRALQDQVDATKQKDEEIDAQYDQYHKQLSLQEQSIKEYMRGLTEQDEMLTKVTRKQTQAEFNMFEFQMAQSRVRDLEAQLDKLLESTTDQRQKIEDYEEKIEKMTFQIERLQRNDKTMTEKIQVQLKTIAKLESDVKFLRERRTELEQNLSETNETLYKANNSIKELESQVYQFTLRIERLENSVEQLKADLSQLQQQNEYNKAQAHIWEGKFHKQVIDKEKAQKVQQDLQREAEHAKQEFQQKENKLISEMEMISEDLNSHRLSLQQVRVKLRGAERAVMRRAIRQRVLHTFAHTLISRLGQQGQITDERLQVLQQEMDTQKQKYEAMLEEKDAQIEIEMFEMEDYRAQSIRAVNERQQIQNKVLTLNGIAENLKATIVFFKKELERADEKNEEHSVSHQKLVEQNERLQAELNSDQARIESEHRDLLDRIDSQKEQIKQLKSIDQISSHQPQVDQADVATQTDIAQLVEKDCQTESAPESLHAEQIRHIINNSGIPEDMRSYLEQQFESEVAKSSKISEGRKQSQSRKTGEQVSSSEAGNEMQSGSNFFPDRNSSPPLDRWSVSQALRDKQHSSSGMHRRAGKKNESEDYINQQVTQPMYKPGQEDVSSTEQFQNESISRADSLKQVNQKSSGFHSRVKNQSGMSPSLSRQGTISRDSSSQKNRVQVFQQISQPRSRDGTPDKMDSSIKSPSIKIKQRAQTVSRAAQSSSQAHSRLSNKRPEAQQIKAFLKSALSRKRV